MKPNQFQWRTKAHHQLHEVAIFADQHSIRIPGGIKNSAVCSVPAADVAKCNRADFKGLFNPPCEMRR
jgi:hypothetical protein